ncbi:MAG: putative bifunctional diguanylate cyclase/phosphodiesterase [Rhizobiaceae bacterium]
MAKAVRPGTQTADEKLRDLQHEVLVAAASCNDLHAVLGLLCRRIEGLTAGAVCSILGVDAHRLIRPLAAPGLPDHFGASVDGQPIGPCAGSCGTAAWRDEPVEVTDIEHDPLWREYRALVLPLGLRACWSTPIRSSDKKVIGTFAFYYRDKRGPTDVERQAVEVSTHLCAIVIEQHEARERIHRLAYYDTVTGLANRALFGERLAEYLSAQALAGADVALLCIDLDDFKSVNDTFGHMAGDELLRQVGGRLQDCVVDGFVARIGGDEFAVIGRFGIDEAIPAAKRITLSMHEPFNLSGNLVSTRASVGVTAAHAETVDGRSLLKQADIALYEAKEARAGIWRVYTRDLQRKRTERRRIEHDLRQGLANGNLWLAFQPIFEIASSSLVGAEALVRWDHPQRGPVSPEDFIPVAEQSGLMPELGEWILATACAAAMRWPDETILSVNISPAQIQAPGFVEDTLHILRSSGLPPRRLQIEVTETALLADAGKARNVIDRLKGEGVKVALDDFGTGYSSLSHIRQFPMDTVKIDRSFIGEFGSNSMSTAIVSAILHIAGQLDIVSTAEGIETAEQLKLLDAAGCTLAQGFHLGRPVAQAAFERRFGFAPAGRVRL